MRPLSIYEYEKHAQQLKVFVDKINSKLLNQSPFDTITISLKEVGYGVKVEHQYVYFDYPFNSDTVPKFNYDLANHKDLKNVDNWVHAKYVEYQNDRSELDYDGYIYFKYFFDEESHSYELLEDCNNLGIENSNENYRKFLPIMDCAINPEKTTYLSDVKTNTFTDSQIREIKNVIILSKRVGKEGSISSKATPTYNKNDNILLCAFEFLTDEGLDLNQLSRNLYDNIFYFLEVYFHSPVLEKLLTDKRKTYILGYKHNLGKLRPDACIENLRSMLKLNLVENIEYELLTLEKICKRIDFTHHLIFDYEFVNAGFSTYNVLLRGKLVSEIVEYFNFEFSENSWNNIDVKFAADYRPKFDIENGNYELFDYILILWNIWSNAHFYHKSLRENIEFYSKVDKVGNIIFGFSNYGKMAYKMIDYLNGVTDEYPPKNKVKNNSHYPGLMIVRNLIDNLPQLSIEASFIEEKNRTQVELILNTDEIIHY